MSAKNPTGEETTASRRRAAQPECRNTRCSHDEQHHSDDHAFKRAFEHAALTGHTVDVILPNVGRTVAVTGRLNHTREETA